MRLRRINQRVGVRLRRIKYRPPEGGLCASGAFEPPSLYSPFHLFINYLHNILFFVSIPRFFLRGSYGAPSL